MRNTARELGQEQFDWWPIWDDEVAIIIAGGASAKSFSYDAVRGSVKAIAIKEAVQLCPWADVVYGCDGPWWVYKNGLLDFQGLKFCYDARVCDRFAGLTRVIIDDPAGNKMLVEKPLYLGAGGNSGFQAINLAVQFGCRKIGLVGFDAHDRAGRSHWYGRNQWVGANNPEPSNFFRWKFAFEKSAPDLINMGVSVVNFSTESDLNCFAKLSLDDAMKTWGLTDDEHRVDGLRFSRGSGIRDSKILDTLV